MIPIQWKQNDKKTMHVNEAENGVVYLTWPAIEKIEGIRHAFSTRIGGVSKEHLSSMNLSCCRLWSHQRYLSGKYDPSF